MLHPGGTVRARDLPARYRTAQGVESEPTPARAATAVGLPPPSAPVSEADPLPPEGIDLKEYLARAEVALIRAAMGRAEGVVAHAAAYLGLRRTTLAEKLRKYGLERDLSVANRGDGPRPRS